MIQNPPTVSPPSSQDGTPMVGIRSHWFKVLSDQLAENNELLFLILMELQKEKTDG